MNREDETLEAINAFALARGYPPSRRELAELLGLRSPSAAQKRLTNLQEQGRIVMVPGQARAIWRVVPMKTETEDL